jgi:hypothetical protein
MKVSEPYNNDMSYCKHIEKQDPFSGYKEFKNSQENGNEKAE